MAGSKYIPGLGKQFKISDNHINAKGGAEKYIPGLGKQFFIDGNTELSRDNNGGAEKYIPGLGKQFFIHPSHVKNLYQ